MSDAPPAHQTLTVTCVWQPPQLCICKRQHFRTAMLCEVCEAVRARRSAGHRKHYAKKWRGEYRAEKARERLGVPRPSTNPPSTHQRKPQCPTP